MSTCKHKIIEILSNFFYLWNFTIIIFYIIIKKPTVLLNYLIATWKYIKLNVLSV